MRSNSIVFIFISLLFTQVSFGAVCPASTTSGTGIGSSCTVTGAASTIQLNFNSGFTDATGISVVGGNNGLSIGSQRTLSFIKVAEILADKVVSSQMIIVDANFSALSCTANSAVLGSAGASTNTGDVSNPMPAGSVSNTLYPIGLINSLGNTDYDGAASDIIADFNSNIGNAGCLQASSGWYYGFDASPADHIGFTTVLLHEMTHGLGFASLVDASTGSKPSGIDDVFSNNLYSSANAALWSVAGGLTDAQRAASAISGSGLLWNGTHTNTQAEGLLTAGFNDADNSSTFTLGDRVQMYAPNPIESGSSVSHFDTAASPNEIMEPQYTTGQLDLGLALYLLKDIGWTVIPAVANAAPATVEVGGSTYNDGDTFILSDSNTQINVNNGSGNYTYGLSYNSSDVSNLIRLNASGLTIALPVSGEFAGDYSLMITDNSDGDVITITIKRPLRLTWSTKAILNGNASQTLKIEGGAVGTVYSLVQSGNSDLIFRNGSGAAVTTVTATADPGSFNSALIHLDSLDVLALSNMDVTVQSSYDDIIETGVKVYPSSLHSFTVSNSANEVLENAVATLNCGEALLQELSVVTSYNTDVNGEFTVLLPDTSVLTTETNYAMNVSFTGYSTTSLVLSSDNITHDVVLVELTNGITLTGEIRANGSQNLIQNPPVVTIEYGDGSSESIIVSITSSTEANFSHEVDLNLKSLNSLTVSQENSITVDWNISSVNPNDNLKIVLFDNVSIVNAGVVDTTPKNSGGAGGSLMGANFFLFLALLFRLLFLNKIKLESMKL